MLTRTLADIDPRVRIHVDAARLLLILAKFSHPIPDNSPLFNFSTQGREICNHFSPAYYLSKLDFLLRYPLYVAHQLIKRYEEGHLSKESRDDIIKTIQTIFRDQEPELNTFHFKKFWYGAYEHLDQVESWWHSRKLVYIGREPRNGHSPNKHYFLSPTALSEAERMVREIEHAQWYAQRISLIHTFFGDLKATQLREREYSYPEYRDADINEHIPDLQQSQVIADFERVFAERMIYA